MNSEAVIGKKSLLRAQTRNKLLNFRVSPAEFDGLVEEAGGSGFRSLSDYVRHKVLAGSPSLSRVRSKADSPIEPALGRVSNPESEQFVRFLRAFNSALLQEKISD